MSAAAVDSATAQMANTTLTEPTSTAEGTTIGAGGDKPINAAQNEAVIRSAAEGRRLYIGNLAYATTEGELKDFFKEYLIESVSIPTNPRTTRPVGYAFVDVSAATEADRAVNELNGNTILDRKVSVQLARRPEEPSAQKGENGQARRRRPAGRGRGRGRGGRRGGRNGRSDKGLDGEEGADDTKTNVPGQVLPLTETDTNANKGENGTSTATKQKTPRPVRQRGPPEDGVPSKNKVMVANLPFEMTEEKLKELFQAYEPTAAKLALRPIPQFMVRKLAARGEARKGRGFAFVTLASEEMQQKAISEMNGHNVEERELAVKVAIDSPGKEDEALDGQANQIEGKENEPSTAEGSASVPAATTSV